MEKHTGNGKDIDLSKVMAKAMLARLKTTSWGAKKNDKKASDEVANNHGSKRRMGRYVKILLESDELKTIRAIFSEASAIHRKFTMPWDGGVRLLPSALYWKYNEALEPILREAEPAIKAFLRAYKKQWESGLKQYRPALGTLFDENDYPSPSELKRRFGIKIKIMPMTNPDDFRIKLGAEGTKAVREQIANDLKADLKDSMRDAYVRLHEMVTRIHEKLDDPVGIFRDTLFENAEEMVELLADLNVTGDPALAEMIGKVKKKVVITDFADVRTDLKKRAQVAKDAKKILRGMRGYVS